MICPSCNISHDTTAYHGCCSRGCQRFAKRKHLLPKRHPATSPPATAVRPVITVPAPVSEYKMLACDDCGRVSPEWATYETVGAVRRTLRCIECHQKLKAAQRAADDDARPSAGPFQGSGGRVVRGVNAL